MNITRIWHTIKYLKHKQVYYQLLLRIKNRRHLKQTLHSKFCRSEDIELNSSPNEANSCFFKDNRFSFLNLRQTFESNPDWNFSEYGKLWTYNLNYFDYLNQNNIKRDEGIALILDFISVFSNIRDGREPYPTSIRGINWIKFLVKYKVKNQDIDNSLCTQYDSLINNLEYHLLGNHLLENAYSLLFGAYYFKNDKYYRKAKLLLFQELDRQVQKDGGHFELSPMYHKILLIRLLDCVNLVLNNNWKKDGLDDFLINKAQLMLGWLESFAYSDLSTANVNDSTEGIAHSTENILKYAKELGLHWQPAILSDSGYRFFKGNNYEMLVDVGNIGPDYIPGHAHADTFNFELIVDNIPVIVDTGISTYEKNARRHLERSTSSHNTVVVNNKNQSDVWGGFRVGKRAKVFNLEEKDGYIKASHDGYKKYGITHNRTFKTSSHQIKIEDTILNITKAKRYTASALLHFHPNISIEVKGSAIKIKQPSLKISFQNEISVKVDSYDYCEGFNKRVKSTVAIIDFNELLSTNISIN